MYQGKKIKGPTEWADITELNLRYGEQPKQVPKGMWMGSVYLVKGKARGFSTPNSRVVQETKGSRSFECTAPHTCHAGDSSDKEPGVKQSGDRASLLPTVTNTNMNKPQYPETAKLGHSEALQTSVVVTAHPLASGVAGKRRVWGWSSAYRRKGPTAGQAF